MELGIWAEGRSGQKADVDIWAWSVLGANQEALVAEAAGRTAVRDESVKGIGIAHCFLLPWSSASSGLLAGCEHGRDMIWFTV